MINIIHDVQAIEAIPSVPDLFRPLPPLGDRITIGLDIETHGLRPDYGRVYMIGIITQNGTKKIITDPDEKVLLTRFTLLMSILTERQQIYLYGHNLMSFDLPFLMRRMDILNVAHGFSYRQTYQGQTMSRAFRIGGSYPLVYAEVQHPNVDIIDTLMLARYNDATWLFGDHTLKTLAIEIGARKERRLELDHIQLDKAWDTGDLELIETYLNYDLDDTKDLFYKFVPPYYQMQSFLPMSMQETVLSGSASKIESLLQKYYPGKRRPEPDEKVKYQGALTKARPGLYRNVHKFDVASQYPFAMLAYRLGPGPKKDPDGKFFSILKELRTQRLKYKALGSTDPEAKAVSEAMKIVINSAYGLLGSTHPYNNFDSAAKVCEYGREIVLKMISKLESIGAVVIEVDTDGVMFTMENYTDGVMDQVLAEMPAGLEMEHEFEASWAYIDAAKNYIIDLGKKVVRKGNFKKRNMQKLYREFVETYCRKYLSSPDEAEQYYQSIADAILSRTMDLAKLSVTRNIGKAEKAVLKYGNIGDKITVYYGYEEGNKKPVPVVDGLYNTLYYKALLDKWYGIIRENITISHALEGKEAAIPSENTEA